MEADPSSSDSASSLEEDHWVWIFGWSRVGSGIEREKEVGALDVLCVLRFCVYGWFGSAIDKVGSDQGASGNKTQFVTSLFLENGTEY
ncbi:unnamed protein product [Thlaspi arvense]|uniref:Uncharacterized protein n=1 Tax=Thlaspi arvense TaxID=13288 RepID=A0AAU9RGU1_THLAR|nr:unnamed protein product [Thlaspi arvense]